MRVIYINYVLIDNFFRLKNGKVPQSFQSKGLGGVLTFGMGTTNMEFREEKKFPHEESLEKTFMQNCIEIR